MASNKIPSFATKEEGERGVEPVEGGVGQRRIHRWGCHWGDLGGECC